MSKTFSTEEIKKSYDSRTWSYSKLVAPFERDVHSLAIEKADIKTGEHILEVAVGPGLILLELAERVGKETKISGIDISAKMLQLAENRLKKSGFPNFDLREADARNLPFEDNSFDVLYNGYMLDLIPREEMHQILKEFQRVLKPKGRLILVSMSKKEKNSKSIHGFLYKVLPRKLSLYFYRGCRPVLMKDTVQKVGFRNVERHFLNNWFPFPSEIVIAHKLS